MILNEFIIPEITSDIPHGDMPGDVIKINDDHIKKASLIFPLLINEINKLNKDKIVVSVFGGSGVGKSEIASILAYYFNANNINTYIMSGDNYPYRIPLHNDEERLSIFRKSGKQALVDTKQYENIKTLLNDLINKDLDSDTKQITNYPFLKEYQQAGREALKKYLGTYQEIDYDKVNDIINQFKNNEDVISFKRMGRKENEIYYESIDTSCVKVLIVEWTHGGSKYLNGIDIPILLNSTPEETKAHRLLRARDGNVDSCFTTMVLEIEQEELDRRREFAKIVISKKGEILKEKK